jgi:predicted acyltransferase
MTFHDSALYLSDRNATRVTSIDVLRGITIFLMLFVNDLAGVPEAPSWLKHAPASADGMTIVDLVFPAFLFVMGMSIPAAIGRRIAAGQHMLMVVLHSLIRTGSLLLIGVLMVNTPNAARMGWPEGIWSLLMYLGVFMVWHSLPARRPHGRILSLVLRIAGALLLIFLAWQFRSAEGYWLRPQWWGILGLIGWAYLISLAVYLLARDSRSVLAGVMALLFCVYVAFREGLLSSPWFGGGTIGSHPAIAVAGVFLGTLVFPGDLPVFDRFRTTLALTGFTAAGAVLLRPLYGIGKNAATPSWSLWAIAITGAVWALLYWLIDLNGWERIGRPFRFLGMNALFAYILAALVYSAFRAAGIDYGAIGRIGFVTGLARSLAFSLFISALAAWAVRREFKLKL